jgi:hypothetical protein
VLPGAPDIPFRPFSSALLYLLPDAAGKIHGFLPDFWKPALELFFQLLSVGMLRISNPLATPGWLFA